MHYSSIEAISEKKGLEEMIKDIASAVLPDKIFCKGRFLLIVISHKSQKPLSEYKTLMEATGIQSLFHYTLCNAVVLENFLTQGHLFYSTLCTKENLVYDSGTSSLPLHLFQRLLQIKKKATHDFMIGYRRAESFLKGATFYMANDEPGMAAFMLHQAAEQSMRALLLAVLGQDVKTHNLAELKQHLKKYSLEPSSILCATSERERHLLDRLEKAYICARYTDCYNISLDDLFQLRSLVKTLLQELKSAFEDLLNRFISPEANYSLPLNLAI